MSLKKELYFKIQCPYRVENVSVLNYWDCQSDGFRPEILLMRPIGLQTASIWQFQFSNDEKSTVQCCQRLCGSHQLSPSWCFRGTLDLQAWLDNSCAFKEWRWRCTNLRCAHVYYYANHGYSISELKDTSSEKLHEWITESHSFKLGKIRASSALAGSLVYFLSYNSSIGLIYWSPRLFFVS